MANYCGPSLDVKDDDGCTALYKNLSWFLANPCKYFPEHTYVCINLCTNITIYRKQYVNYVGICSPWYLGWGHTIHLLSDSLHVLKRTAAKLYLPYYSPLGGR